MKPQLQLVDPETGELVAPGCRQCHEHTTKIAGLEADLVVLTKQLATVIHQRDANKKIRDLERLNHRNRKRVEAIFEDWQEICGKQKSKLGSDRFDVISARLNNGYTEEHFHLAALGAMHNNPWRKGEASLMVEIETYARNSRWLELFANAGAEWCRRTGHAGEIRVKCGATESPRSTSDARGPGHKEQAK